MNKKISIDPITRLEGHGKIDIYLNESGNVAKTFFQVPELRGFEKFVIGRPAEDMPQITSRICGVCPTAHHMAATKALDGIYGVSPTATAQVIRELFYTLFMFEDHILHFFFLGGPDLLVGPTAVKEKRNIVGVIEKVGIEIGKKVIYIRTKARNLMAEIGGKPVHPVLGLAGGVAKQITEETQQQLIQFSEEAEIFARFCIDAFNSIVLQKQEYVDLIFSQAYTTTTNYMGMVDENDHVNFYNGTVKVVNEHGKEIERFLPQDYTSVIAEHVESWTYMKFPYLRKRGWKGFVDGENTSLYRVAPLARLNVAKGMATEGAQKEYERFYQTMGEKPAHSTLGIHWARLVEILYCAEHLKKLSIHPLLCSPDIRNMNLQTPGQGIGIVEAPRGTLIHHYQTDKKGVITNANLIVATVNNAASITLSIDKAARHLIKNGVVNDGLLNMVEMAFRAYDPCLSCATHSQPGTMPLMIRLMDLSGNVISIIKT